MTRVAIVTGAGKRVGWHLAEGLLAQGWRVVAHVRGDEDAVPSGAVRVAADLAAGAEAADLIVAACPEPPALLVNNAARFVPDALGGFSPEELQAHMAVNVAAPALQMPVSSRLSRRLIMLGARRFGCRERWCEDSSFVPSSTLRVLGL